MANQEEITQCVKALKRIARIIATNDFTPLIEQLSFTDNALPMLDPTAWRVESKAADLVAPFAKKIQSLRDDIKYMPFIMAAMQDPELAMEEI